MSLNEHFNQRARTAHDKQIADACTRLLSDLQSDVARLKKIADGEGNVFTRYGLKATGSAESGVLKYRLLRLRSKGSPKFEVWYENGRQMKRHLQDVLPSHPALKKIHEYCAQHATNFRIDHEVDENMSVGMVTHTHYIYDVYVTVRLLEPYKNSKRMMVSPPTIKPPAPPAPTPSRATFVTTTVTSSSAPAAPVRAPLTKAQVADYLRNLRNEQDKEEFIALLGGVRAPKNPLRVQIKKPHR